MSQVLIPPTVGRVVWFHPSLLTGEAGFASPKGDVPLAAIVAHVWSDTLVNLAVFDANGVSHSRTSVRLIHEELTADCPSEAFCTWMPFQKGQAKAQAAAAPAPATDSAIESEIQAKGKTAPRVTPSDIADNIVSEHYFTAFDGIAGAAFNEACPDGALKPFQFVAGGAHALLTFCVLVLQNGFTVTGESACASPENFDAEIGKRIARENAVQKVWPLMGYALKQRLHDELASTPQAADA